MRDFLGPLRRRLALVFAIAVWVPAIFGLFAALQQYDGQVKQAHETTVRYATLASNSEADLVRQSDRLLTDVSTDPAIQARANALGDFAACRAVLKQTIAPYPAYAALSLLKPDGTVLCRSSDDPRPSTAPRQEWFDQVVATRKPVISGYTFAKLIDEPVIVYGSPILAAGELRAVLALGIRLRWLALNGQVPGLPPDASVDLLDKTGLPLFSKEVSGDQTPPNLLPEPALLAELTSGRQETFDAVDRNGVLRNYALHPIGDNNLFILLGQPTKRLIAPLQRDLAIQILILLLFVIAGMAAATIGSRILVTRWINMLTADARLIAAGDTPKVTNFKGAPTEIRQLSDTLLSMAVTIRTREAELTESLTQKQMMLREIHHRVKNNLQTVTSLLNLYARIPRGEAIKQAFADVQTRINALALVHRHLYESQDLREIDLAAFMTGLCKLVQDGSGVPSRRVRMNVTVPHVTLSGDRAVPLALLATEVLTNAFKHAFPEHRAGTIDVTITVEGNDALMTISDDGIGVSDQENVAQLKTMGHSLMNAFTRQLGGTLTVSPPPGTTVELAFAVVPAPIDQTLPGPDGPSVA